MWHKSTRSEAIHCVEVDDADKRVVQMRDSKDPEGPILSFSVKEWKKFLNEVKEGKYDLEN